MRYLVLPLVVGAAFGASQARAQTFKTLLQFSGTGGITSGENARGDLTLSGTTLYGVTLAGGANGDGNIFSVATNGTNYQNLVSFTGTGGAASGESPGRSLALSGTTLYGMSNSGGVYGLGNIYAVGVDGTNYRNLVSFTGTGGSASGQNPLGGLTLSGTTLYGMNYSGGDHGFGNIFAVGIDGTNYENLFSFNFGGSTDPKGNLVVSGTTLYGTSSGGGSLGYGSIFKVGINGMNYQNLVSFTGSNSSAPGAYPWGDLLLSGTTLYGITTSGGANNDGNIFSVGVNGMNFENLVSFTGIGGTAIGADPEGSLILSGTTLYGTALAGGSHGNGCVYSVGTDGSHFADLYNFTGGTDGGLPAGALTLSGGTLFGMTGVGGDLTQNFGYGAGTVFALTLPAPTPEPGTLVLVGTAAVALFSCRWQRRRMMRAESKMTINARQFGFRYLTSQHGV
jgi:uncharacterized repeat protein (TIGR03803 family)